MARLSAATGDFLARLVRLEPLSLVRVRGTDLWSSVPWNVLVRVSAAVPVPGDITVRAAAWLALDADDPSSLERYDSQWRAGMPSGTIVRREALPADIIRRMSVAAAETLRATESGGLKGRTVGARVLRDALLDHVPITVAADVDHDTEVRVPQRLVQAVVRMGFIAAEPGPDPEIVRIVTSGPWIGISAARGDSWWRPSTGLRLDPHRA